MYHINIKVKLAYDSLFVKRTQRVPRVLKLLKAFECLYNIEFEAKVKENVSLKVFPDLFQFIESLEAV